MTMLAFDRTDRSLRFLMVATICFCVVLSMSTWFSTAAVVPQLRRLWQISDVMASWLTISVQLGFVAGAFLVVIGGVVDRYSPRKVMGVAACGASVVNLGLVWADSLEVALLLRFLTGLFMAGIYPPALKLVASWSERSRGLVFGAIIGALTTGSALPHLVNWGGGIAWTNVIVLTSCATAIGGAGILLLTRTGPFQSHTTTFSLTHLRSAVTDRTFVLITVGYLGHMWELYAAWAWMLVIVRERFASYFSSGDMPSLVTFAFMFIGAPACIATGYLADRYGRIAVTCWCMAVSGLCAALLGVTFLAPAWLFFITGLIWGASMIGDSGQFSALVTERCDPRLVGTVLTVQLGLGFALTAITIWLVPVVAGIVGWQWAALCLVPGPIVGILAMRALMRADKRTTKNI